MFCLKCGEVIPEESIICPMCGADLKNIDSEAPTGGEVLEGTIQTSNFMKKNKKRIGIGIIVVVLLLIIMLIVNSVQTSALKKELMRDWSSVEGEDDAYILCVLDFSEDEIEYRLETGYAWMDMTVDTYDYKVVSGNKIKVNMYGDEWTTVTVEFDEDKTMMTVTPALTSVDDEEFWFNFD